MQEGLRRGAIGKAQAELGRHRLKRRLGGEEILSRAVHADAERRALFGHRRQRKGLGDVHARQLEQAGAVVAATDVAHQRVQHGGRERRAHHAHILADRVADADGALHLPVQAQEGVILRGNEGVGDDLAEILPVQGALGARRAALFGVQAAVGDRRRAQEGALDVVIAVLADDLLGEVGITVHVLAVGGGRDGQRVAAHFDFEVEAFEDADDVRLRDLDAEQRVDLRRRRRDRLRRGLRDGDVKAVAGDLPRSQARR